MIDEMPTNIWALDCENEGGWRIWFNTPSKSLPVNEYTLVHNNPDYHVIKKSDVDGDVMRALDRCHNFMTEETYQLIRNALIAQSDPDTVMIPREVLEGWREVFPNNGDAYDRGALFIIDKVYVYKDKN
jgi:hypothetical protein